MKTVLYGDGLTFDTLQEKQGRIRSIDCEIDLVREMFKYSTDINKLSVEKNILLREIKILKKEDGVV